MCLDELINFKEHEKKIEREFRRLQSEFHISCAAPSNYTQQDFYLEKAKTFFISHINEVLVEIYNNFLYKKKFKEKLSAQLSCYLKQSSKIFLGEYRNMLVNNINKMGINNIDWSEYINSKADDVIQELDGKLKSEIKTILIKYEDYRKENFYKKWPFLIAIISLIVGIVTPFSTIFRVFAEFLKQHF